MPELPEVETVRRGLEPVLAGRRIQDVTLRRKQLRNAFPPGFAQTLSGARVKSLRRRAKYLLADLDNGYVWLTHLGMSGSFRTVAKGARFEPEKHDHVVLTLSDGSLLVFNDPRRFGIMDIYKREDEDTYKALAGLGPEPLSNAFSGPVLESRLMKKNIAIKVALLDQKIVAGVGNIYASEALFRAGIDPRKKSKMIRGQTAENLAAAIKDVLNDAIRSGGSTLRNHRQMDGNLGYFQHSFAVYDHAGERCKGCTCGGKKRIAAFTQAGRTTFFCPVKQR